MSVCCLLLVGCCLLCSAKSCRRMEQGTNVTWSERISLTEMSVWSSDGEDEMVTRYSKSIELYMDMYWIPQWVTDTVIQPFTTASIQCRERDTQARVAAFETRGGVALCICVANMHVYECFVVGN